MIIKINSVEEILKKASNLPKTIFPAPSKEYEEALENISIEAGCGYKLTRSEMGTENFYLRNK
jgi:hypothetical protein